MPKDYCHLHPSCAIYGTLHTPNPMNIGLDILLNGLSGRIMCLDCQEKVQELIKKLPSRLTSRFPSFYPSTPSSNTTPAGEIQVQSDNYAQKDVGSTIRKTNLKDTVEQIRAVDANLEKADARLKMLVEHLLGPDPRIGQSREAVPTPSNPGILSEISEGVQSLGRAANRIHQTIAKLEEL